MKRKDNVVWRLLRHNISAGQLIGYALANFTGLAIVLTALQFYRDVNTMWEAEDSFISRDYMIISKKVETTLLNTDATYDPNSFTVDERRQLSSQPWARRVGEFVSAGCPVAISFDVPGSNQSLGTEMFMESIPDSFFDVKPAEWDRYNPEDESLPVPIILSKDYLALWNFGFASSRGLPQLSENAIKGADFDLIIGNRHVPGGFERRKAFIAGFSSRFNTVVVPENFINWVNANYASGQVPPPSRLIVEVSSPGDPVITDYLEEHDYEVAGDKLDNAKAARFFTIVTVVVIAVGVIISLLAFFILLLSIYLLLQKNREKIRDLILLGYTPGSVARHYHKIVIAVNLIVLVCALAAAIAGCHLWSGPLEDLGVEGASPWATIITGVTIVALITAGNVMAISRNVRRTVE